MWVSGALLVTGKTVKDSQDMKTLNYQPVWGLDQQSSSWTGLRSKGARPSVLGDRDLKGKWHPNQIKAYIPDWFVLVVTENSTCTQACKCSELERFPLKPDFTSHKNLGCDVVLSLFSPSTRINTHYIIHFRREKKEIAGYRPAAWSACLFSVANLDG